LNNSFKYFIISKGGSEIGKILSDDDDEFSVTNSSLLLFNAVLIGGITYGSRVFIIIDLWWLE
jgi:hypothetical protein